MALDIRGEGLPGCRKRRLGQFWGLHTSQLGVQAMAFGGLCPSGDRWPSAAHLFCPSHSTTIPEPCWATSDISSLAGSLLTVSLSLPLPRSLWPPLTLPESICLSRTLSLSASLWIQLRLSLRISVPVSPFPFLNISLSLSLTVSLSQSLLVSLSPPRWFPLRLSRGPNSRPRIEFSGNKGK